LGNERRGVRQGLLADSSVEKTGRIKAAEGVRERSLMVAVRTRPATEMAAL
jgi:hypothetical protein